MYNPEVAVKINYHFTVGDLIKALSNFSQDASVSICGDDYFYIHQEMDGTAVNIDVEALDENYEDEINPCDDWRTESSDKQS